MTRFAHRASLTALAAALLAGPAFAQTAEPVRTDTGTTPTAEATGTSPSAAADMASPADVIVTGSRIRGVAPVGSSVIAIDQAKIAQEPVISTADLLRRVPQVVSLGANRAGGTGQNAAANATRGAGINLRGISTNATLLLYEGRRLPPQGTQGQFTDPSVIPSIALGRVEVVADGASAVYGSDAIAGVVNFVLRKNFDGLEGRIRYGFTDGNYKEYQAAAIAGKTWDGGWAMLAGEYTRNDTLFGRDLSFYQDDNTARGGRDLRVNACNPGTLTAAGSTYAIPQGGVTAANAAALVRGTQNRCFYNGADAVIPEQQRYSVTGAASHEITDGIRLFVDGFWSRRNGEIPRIDTATIAVPSSNPFYVAPVGVTPALCAASVGAPAGARCVNVAYSFFPELGAVYNPYHADSWNVAGGVEARLFGDFKATAYYAYGRSDEVSDRRLGLNTAALNAAVLDPNRATAFNAFGGANNPATLARLRDNLFVITGRTRLEVFNAQADGSLFALPGGNVRIAVGGEHRVEYTFTDLLTGQQAAQTSVRDAGTRNVDAVFGELFVPVVGAANAASGFEQVSLSLALRHENYSDFGSTTNPKIGVTYKPFPGLTLKGSYGTSFRAPTFTEVSQVAGGAGLYFDTLPGAAGNQTGIGLAGGNPGLAPESATTWSAGIEAAPPAIPGLVATVNYFRIDYKDQIIALRGTAGILTNPLYAQFVELNPTPARVAALVASGLPINSAINQSATTFIVDGRRQNLGTTLLRGLDFALNYTWTVGDARFDAGVNGTKYLSYRFEAVTGAGLAQVLDTFGFTQNFRAQGDVGVNWRGLRARATINHLAGYFNTTVTPRQRIGDYDTVDFSIGYDLTRNINLSVDARNVFDEEPPFVDTTRGYDPNSANPVPRLISITAGVKF